MFDWNNSCHCCDSPQQAAKIQKLAALHINIVNGFGLDVHVFI
jgi:hypothetical protein